MRYLLPLLTLTLLAPAVDAGGIFSGLRSRSTVRERVVVREQVQVQKVQQVRVQQVVAVKQYVQPVVVQQKVYAAPVRALAVRDYCPPVAAFRSYSYVQPVYVAPQYVAPVQQYVAPPPQAFNRDCCEEVLAELRSMRLEMQQRFPLQAPPKP